ncbi:beta-glucoside-specific PTS transporter subunit IIABC [Enterococcus sp. AZ103]|uniref:beta-glucoside-specific PTS transporter subunit IIABC n=1 Tax=Enterococcus sp. AZ103 TaxID=2774628 RepID=UPI003F26EA91
MNYQETAKEIVEEIGGKENVAHLEHCSTRLRFTLKDKSKANEEALGKIDGVMGVRQNVQLQVIIGNEVVEVFDQVKNLIGDGASTTGNDDGPKEKQKIGAVILDFIISVFQPLIPAIAGGGILRSLLLLASLVGVMSDQSQTYQVLYQIGGAPLYFLPILVAITTARKLKVNELVAVSVVGVMILPSLTALITEGTSLLSFGIENIDYGSQVFPAILTVLFYAVMEKFFTKYSFKSIRIFFVPMMSLLITAPVALLILGPLGFNIGTIFSGVIVALYNQLGWVATGLLAAVLPLMVVTGMHKAMIPYAVSSMSELGMELLYLPASLAHNISESGASFAVSLRTKDKKLKATAVSAGISALFGITEPALYGVTILHKRVLYAVMASSLIGGAVAGLTAIRAFALVGPGLASITMYADPSDAMNLVWAFVVLGLSFVLSFVITLIFFKDAKVEETVEKTEMPTNLSSDYTETLASPLTGKVIPLSEVKDEVFSSGMVGSGVGILPEEGKLYAPADAEVTMVFETGHALGLRLDSGAEILFHIGIDTVQMQGDGFTPKVQAGDQVKKGQLLIEFDIAKIEAAGFDPTLIYVVTNHDKFNVASLETEKEVTNESDLLAISLA